jgi:predicted MFS family arabinose efflux permease
MKAGIDPEKYKWLVLTTAVLAVTGALGFGRFSYAMILSPMQKGLLLSTIQAGDLAAGNMLGYLGCSIAIGIITTRVAPKKVVSYSLLFVGVSLVITGLAGSYLTALLARIVAGAFSAGANITIMGMLSAWFSSEKRGLAGGIAVSGTSVGLVISGIAVPFFIARFGIEGWRHSWFALGGLTLLFTLMCFVVLKNDPAELTHQESRKPRLPGNIGTVLKNPHVRFIALIYVLFGFSYIIYATFFSDHLIGEHGFSIAEAGKLWSIIGVASLASGFIWGVFSDRIGRKYGLGMVLFLQACSFLSFGLAGPLWSIYLSVILFALTAWSIPAIVAAAAGDFVGSELAPAAFGFLTAVFGIGQVLGPFVGARMAAATGSYSPVLILAAAAAFMGAVLSMFLGNNLRRKEGTN